MRGDSRRDLYSKALALCGLGVLAGAGALVDYWPMSVRFPVAISPDLDSTRGQVADVLALPANPLEEFETLLAAVPAPAAPRVSAVASSQEMGVPVLAYAPLPIVAVGYDLGTPLDVETLPEPAFLTARYELPVVDAGPQDLLPAPSAHRLPYAPPVSALEDDNGFFSSAFRKTGSSIVKTGVKTGTSLVGAVRMFGSVVRRALPD